MQTRRESYAKWAVILVLDSISINIGIGILLFFILIEANEEGKVCKVGSYIRATSTVTRLVLMLPLA